MEQVKSINSLHHHIQLTRSDQRHFASVQHLCRGTCRPGQLSGPSKQLKWNWLQTLAKMEFTKPTP